jgi:RNA polymerase sigma-70 factor, ECF subfamily
VGDKLLGHLILKLPGNVVMFTAVGYSSGLGIWMDDALEHEITQLLQAWRQGDERALDKLTPQVYCELHRAALRCMPGERDGHTLQTTALVNELCQRLTDLKLIDWQNRAHFFALGARQMRRILSDQARARQSHKRGDGAKATSLDDARVISPEPSADLVAVDDVLNQLAKVDDRKSQVVTMRFFGGL